MLSWLAGMIVFALGYKAAGDCRNSEFHGTSPLGAHFNGPRTLTQGLKSRRGKGKGKMGFLNEHSQRIERDLEQK